MIRYKTCVYNKRCGVSFSPPAVASEDEEYDDVTVSQMLSPKKEEMDATQILNNLLKEYDKKLRPDIGGEWTSAVPGRFLTGFWNLIRNSYLPVCFLWSAAGESGVSWNAPSHSGVYYMEEMWVNAK